MRFFTVTLAVEIEADSPEEAVAIFRDALPEYQEIQTTYIVEDHITGEVSSMDLPNAEGEI